MKEEEFNSHVEKIRYKPNFRIMSSWGTGRPISFDKSFGGVSVDMFVPNAIRSEQAHIYVVRVSHYFQVALEGLTKDSLLAQVRAQLRYMEQHELEEWFTYEGQQVDGPHGCQEYVPYWSNGEPDARVDPNSNRDNKAAAETQLPGIRAAKMLRQADHWGGETAQHEAPSIRPVLPERKVPDWRKRLLHRARTALGFEDSAGGD